MVQPGQDSGFPIESVADILRNPQSWFQGLDRHLSIEAFVHSEVNLAHPSGADELLNSNIADMPANQAAFCSVSENGFPNAPVKSAPGLQNVIGYGCVGHA